MSALKTAWANVAELFSAEYVEAVLEKALIYLWKLCIMFYVEVETLLTFYVTRIILRSDWLYKFQW